MPSRPILTTPVMPNQLKSLWSSALIVGLLVLATAASLAAANVQTVLTAAAPGPTILLIHQSSPDDVSGAIAVKQVSRWTLTKGKVVAATGADLDTAVKATAPAAIVMLKVEKTTKKDAPPSSLLTRGLDAAALREKLNAILDPGTAPLTSTADQPTLPPGAGAAAVIELSFLAQRGAASPGERTRLFRHAVHEVLAAHGMTPSSPWTLLDPATKKIKVAIYAGGGSSTTPGLAAYPACLDRAAADIDYTYVGPVELAQPNMLAPFDVVIFCGGSGSGQAKSLGETGAAAVKAFVQRGGGYVSSCAGTYLATSGYSWSLKLTDADTVDSKHWARGSGPVDIELTDEGRKILGNYTGLQSVRYANGPLLGKARDSGGLAPYTVLAHFRSDMAKNVPGGVMPNTPAMIAGDFGQGRVICFSPHPEYTEPLQPMIARAVKWAAKRSVSD
jgi:glutamine amidotransferase-like uncharacterized protein